MGRKKGTHHDICKFRAKGRRGGVLIRRDDGATNPAKLKRVCDVLLETTFF